MKGLTSERLLTEAPEARPSYENLCKHADKYGLDNEHKKGRNQGKPIIYTTYKTFRNDALIEVGRARLSQEAYAMLVERYGEHAWRDEALADWDAVRDAADG